MQASALEPLVGTYQFAPGKLFTITRTGDQLKAQQTGQLTYKIYPESATHFFFKVVRAQVSFQTNANGKVTGLVVLQNRHSIAGFQRRAAACVGDARIDPCRPGADSVLDYRILRAPRIQHAEVGQPDDRQAAQSMIGANRQGFLRLVAFCKSHAFA
ncbi:MAG: DUF3471 domain-containing protein [Rhodanobacteraceae bacterium]